MYTVAKRGEVRDRTCQDLADWEAVHNGAGSMYVERVAEWLRRWTRDLGVTSSIPGLVMCTKPWASFGIYIASGHPAVMGTCHNRSKVGSSVVGCRMRSSARGGIMVG